MNKHEKKFDNTSAKIQRAFFELLDKKEYLDITISDLCKQAKIYRSTFYNHYFSLAEVLEDAVKSLIEFFIAEYNKKNPKNLSNPATIENFLNRKTITTYLQFVKQHSKIFYIYLNNKNILEKESSYESMKKLFSTGIKKFSSFLNERQIEYITYFFVSSITSITTKWINDGYIESENEIYNIIMICLNQKQYN